MYNMAIVIPMCIIYGNLARVWVESSLYKMQVCVFLSFNLMSYLLYVTCILETVDHFIGKLGKHLQDTKLPHALKKKIFMQSVIPALLFAAETWTTTKTIE